MHDVTDPGMREACFVQRVLDECPRKSIISLLKLDLDRHNSFPYPSCPHHVEGLLIYYYIVSNLAPRYKTTLVRGYEIRHILLQSVCHCIRYDFVSHVA